MKPCPKQNLLEEMHEQTSSSSIEFEPLLPSPHCVVLNHNRDTTMIFHDEPFEIENSWARASSEALLKEDKREESSNGIIDFSEVVWIDSPSITIPCSIRGIAVEAQLIPNMEGNIMSSHLAL